MGAPVVTPTATDTGPHRVVQTGAVAETNTGNRQWEKSSNWTAEKVALGGAIVGCVSIIGVVGGVIGTMAGGDSVACTGVIIGFSIVAVVAFAIACIAFKPCE